MSYENMEAPNPAGDMSDAQKKIRDDFVRQYLRDYDPYEAVVRMGYQDGLIKPMLAILQTCPYVAQQIRLAEDEQDSDETVERRRIFAALRREASYKGFGASHAARVAALAKLASLRGMDKPIEVHNQHRGGVMVLPAEVSVDAWEAAATAQQDGLSRDA